MLKNTKIRAIPVLFLAVIFFLFFQFTKHDPLFSSINPFGSDPYDAVGSFGSIIVVISSVLLIFRVLRKNSEKVINTMNVICLAVLATMFSNEIALVRFHSNWVGKPGGQSLLILTVGMLALSIIISYITGFKTLTIQNKKLNKALLVSIVLAIILFLYPDRLQESIVGSIVTALTGGIVIFTFIWSWIGFPKIRTKYLGIVLMSLIVIVLGLFGMEFVAEGGFENFRSLLLVASVFTFIGVSGLMLGYVFLSDYLF